MLQTFNSGLEEVQDIPGLRTFMADQVGALGFSGFGYLALRGPGGAPAPVMMTTYPDAWVRHYAGQGSINHDPVVQRGMNSLTPFTWAEVRAKDTLSANQRRVMDDAAAFGLRDGASVPVHGPGGRFASFSVTADGGPDALERLWPRHAMELHLMALNFHAAVDRLLQDSQGTAAVHLTERERESLLWTAEGKTAWETAEIMQISYETVNFHLKNAMRKMGVYSKHHAVVKAIMTGLIVPSGSNPALTDFHGFVVNLLGLGVSPGAREAAQ